MKIDSNGVHIHVRELGFDSAETPALVFLHYWGGSSRTWDDVIAALPNVYRTIAPDHRGWGDSDQPASGYALADLADDARRVIDALAPRRFVLIGHSMGGKVAQLLASRRPQGLAGLVLVAPSPPVPLSLPPEALAAMEGAYTSRASVEATLDGMLSARPLSPARRQQVIDDSLRGAAAAKTAWPRATSQEDISREVASIEVPTLVIAGELDRVDSVATLEAELLPRVPQAVMHVLPGTGHLSPLESPDEIATLIHAFTQRLGSSQR
ncbi:alpha/beta fold hydrolase [Paraburkholderia sp. BCC1884]|uniref:alpha/beta fold hydrolase n=1 Tax=Paraburkholderia sp. BCC1884 TaxID=2562668 RepID=UPI0011846809|nr:alpha/beta hydrolase [Paraburkholderia sp. BCC1884]